ncbi:MAG: hypothetical protein AVDCRST_MAG88-2051, partial [uncultured Thermomicrobiales bacterium]
WTPTAAGSTGCWRSAPTSSCSTCSGWSPRCRSSRPTRPRRPCSVSYAPGCARKTPALSRPSSATSARTCARACCSEWPGRASAWCAGSYI